MYINKKQFYTRKNKKRMYDTYQQHWSHFITTCEVFQDKYTHLERLINEYKDTEHVYKFLTKVKDNVTCLAQYRIACMYQGGVSSDVVLSLEAYRQLMFNTNKIGRATGEIESAILFCDMLKKNDLTVRSR